jgi:pimeloyl-ACP methyl ester carboxylesterase
MHPVNIQEGNQPVPEAFVDPSFYHEILGHRLAFYESEGNGETVLLLHGHPVWSAYYKHQLTGEFGEKYHVISFDFPGCGNSAPAIDPTKTYTLDGLSIILCEVLKFLQTPCWIVGHSMGSNIGLQAAAKDSNHIKGFFLSGLALISQEPVQEVVPPINPDIALIFKKDLSEDELNRIANAALYRQEKDIHELIVRGIKLTDHLLTIGMLTDLGKPEHTANHIAFLNSTSIPLALIDGKEDFLTNSGLKKKLRFPTLWKKELIIVKDADHYLHSEECEIVNSLIDEFIVEQMQHL